MRNALEEKVTVCCDSCIKFR